MNRCLKILRPSPCAVLVITLVVGHGAVAARTVRERAAELMRAGNALYNEGKFVEALELYRQAEARYPSHKLDFNIGVTLAALGKAVEAAEHLERFVARDRDRTPQMVDLARRKLAALQERLARIGVICERDGATVYVDGRFVGRTPMPGWVYLDPGPHRIAVAAPGLRAFQQTIVLYPGDHPRVTATLASGVVPARRVEVPHRPTRPERTAVYRRWWLWTIVGVFIAGATAGTVLSLQASRNERLPHGALGVIR
jgi:tetratricopeptide (TPR) repeat protein